MRSTGGSHMKVLYQRIAAMFLAILGLTALVNCPAWAQQPETASPGTAAQAPVGPNDVVLTVGDEKITAAEFEKLIKTLPPDAAGALAAMGKKGFAERYANLLSLSKEGEKRKVDQNETFQQMVKFQRLMLLAQFTVNEIATNSGEVSADEVNYYYTAHLADFQQVKLRGIYIPFEDPAATAKDSPAAKPGSSPPPAAKGAKPKLTETEARTKANALRLRIQGGESMATLAKKESDHATASNGGDFGFVRRNQFTPQIDNVIFALEKDQVSVPVKDRFGYFIFQVDDKRTQPLEETKMIIENGLRQQKVGEVLSKVQEQYKTEYNQRYFVENAPANPVIPGATPVPRK